MLIFTDDHSIISWLYLLQVKSDAFDCFVKFKALVEKEYDYFIKKLKTDLVENSFLMNSRITITNMESSDSTQLCTLNKMEC